MANSSTTTPPDSIFNMMVEAFKLAQPNSVISDGSKSKSIKFAQPNSVISDRSKSKRAEWTKDQKNDSTGKIKPVATPMIITVIDVDMMSIIPALHANGLNPKNKKTINPLQQPTIPWVAA